jgi:2-polyprenyl-3-methyl-5-hydroxy-6-metoxy-1,4-benzoquinol methylase
LSGEANSERRNPPKLRKSTSEAETSGQFNNREYWEDRYRANPERGSGVGSRGEFRRMKEILLNQIIKEVRPRSILDVGCGDLEVVKNLSFSGKYTGIDLSPSIIERNQLLRPDWTFIVGDFLELAHQDALKADVVICFDVLIHQHDVEIYREFVRELVEVAQRVAVINGFESPKFVGGKICAFHEPLTETLSAVGAANVTPIGRYRGTRIFRVDK